VNDAPVVTVVGKAFWDIGHAPKDQSNRRKYMPGYAAWQRLRVVGDVLL
jgi:hypothetical protein